ncbi:stress-responsive transcription regulator [Philodulcilactobacillus myokoensis]|uniref:Stress-responsive transcription regulator n=1 Tax=Philodulcilactobacillus myokoensis TaxID=2929573 RepID=A0A9W6B1M8_9LACO|nr:PspC domain-containing protein [Philodulcilactobacillus myokoensis]GLB47141.1 stress-responsive transcription regulator [Philodulcilactobacillus myokoensis]
MEFERKLRKASDPEYKLIFGVLGGFAKYYHLNTNYLWLIRIIYTIFTIATAFGFGIVIYLLMAIIMPSENGTTHHFNDDDSTNGGRKILHDVHEEDDPNH